MWVLSSASVENFGVVFLSSAQGQTPWRLQRPGKGRNPGMLCTAARILSWLGFFSRGVGHWVVHVTQLSHLADKNLLLIWLPLQTEAAQFPGRFALVPLVL